jgi:hypothetical protein
MERGCSNGGDASDTNKQCVGVYKDAKDSCGAPSAETRAGARPPCVMSRWTAVGCRRMGRGGRRARQGTKGWQLCDWINRESKRRMFGSEVLYTLDMISIGYRWRPGWTIGNSIDKQNFVPPLQPPRFSNNTPIDTRCVARISSSFAAVIARARGYIADPRAAR